MVVSGLRSTPSISAIVLAAGSGSRLRANRPSLIEDLCGQPIVASVLRVVVEAGASELAVVVASGAEDVVKTLQGRLGDVGLSFAEQHVQRGTGDAVLAGLSALDDLNYDYYSDDDDDGHVLVVHGDMPLLTADVLSGLIDHHLQSGAEATVLAAPAVGPLGRHAMLDEFIDTKRIKAASRDVAAETSRETAAEPSGERAIAGCYVIRRGLLAAAIRRTSPQALRGEFNLNDAIAVLASAGHKVESFTVNDLDSVRSVSTYEDLATAEAIVRRRLTTNWMARGVRMVDPSRTYIDADVVLGTGVVLQPGTILRGFTVVGDYAELGPDTHLTDCAVGQRAKVIRTTGRDAEIGPEAIVGPFAALEPGAQVAANVVTGPNFVGQYAD